MIESNDELLMTYDEKSKVLRPIIFFSYSKTGTVMKDVNNRKEVLSIEKIGNILTSDYVEENDSKVGFAMSDSCMGGSTASCIAIAVSACDQDKVCSLMCIKTGWRCLAAIAAACAIHCNNGSGEE